MLLECKDPSSVNSQVIVPNPPVMPILAQVALNLLSEAESRPADADDASAPRSTVAPTTTRSSLPSFIYDHPRFVQRY
jgi:hypothetical protein